MRVEFLFGITFLNLNRFFSVKNGGKLNPYFLYLLSLNLLYYVSFLRIWWLTPSYFRFIEGDVVLPSKLCHFKKNSSNLSYRDIKKNPVKFFFIHSKVDDFFVSSLY